MVITMPGWKRAVLLLQVGGAVGRRLYDWNEKPVAKLKLHSQLRLFAYLDLSLLQSLSPFITARHNFVFDVVLVQYDDRV